MRAETNQPFQTVRLDSFLVFSFVFGVKLGLHYTRVLFTISRVIVYAKVVHVILKAKFTTNWYPKGDHLKDNHRPPTWTNSLAMRNKIKTLINVYSAALQAGR